MMSSVTGGQIGQQPAAAAAGGSPSACAACKYQRRRCTRDCILAPYFPADNQKQFLNAHRLFGVANIMKILNSVEPERRRCAMRSIIDQSNFRAADPVGGCYRIVVQLEKKIAALRAELDFVRTKIAFFRAQMQSTANIANSSEANFLPVAGPDFYPNMGVMQPQQQQQQYYNYYLLGAQEAQGLDLNGNMISNGVGLDMNINVPGNHGLDMEMLSLGQVVDGEEEARPFVDIFNMRPGFELDGDSREITADHSTVTALHHYSPKIEPIDEVNHMENVLEHDLKGAASLFTLTNCNTR